METKQTAPSDLLRRAKILFASGQLQESINHFTLAEERGCATTDLWLSRGAAQLALGNYSNAKEDFSRVLAEDTKNERACYFRGIANVALGEYEAGIVDLTSSLIQNNNRGIAHLIRGVAFAELGQKSDALLEINSASAFSTAEINSFNKIFADMPDAFQNTRALLAKENAPWNNLLNQKAAHTLINQLQ